MADFGCRLKGNFSNMEELRGTIFKSATHGFGSFSPYLFRQLSDMKQPDWHRPTGLLENHVHQ
jgi:hypothetical protein